MTRTVPPHWHSEFQLCLITRGGGDLLYKGVRHRTPAGTMFAVHPGEVHANETALTEGCSYCTFNVDSHVIESLDPIGRGLSFYLHPLIEDADVIGRFLDCFHGIQAGASRLEIESSLLASMTGLIVRHGRTSRPLPAVACSPKAVRTVRDYLIDNHAYNVSLRELAHLAGLSPFHLVRTFKDRVGIPPHQFLVCVRLEHAKQLLRQGGTVARVAADCGYADQSHLIRSFKRVVGVTPAAYRGPVRST